MSLALPEMLQQALAAHAASAGGPPAGLPAGLGQPPQQDQDEGYDQLSCLRDVIDDFPRLLTELKDPKDVQDAVSALRLLAGIQTRLMGPANGSPPQG